MPADLTSTGLVGSVRRNAALGPGNASAFPSDNDILAWMNEEMLNSLVTLLMRPREEFFVAYYPFALVASQAEYRIPIRSLWDDSRDVQVLRQDGTDQWISLPRIQPEEAPLYNWNGTSGQGAQVYYLRAGNVVFVPTPAGGQTARIKYFLTPGNIVTSTNYSALSALTGTSSPYAATVGSTAGITGTSYDFTANFAPFDVILTSVAGSVTDSTTLSLTLSAADAATLSAAIASGVYVLRAGDAPGPQIPQALASYLEQRTTYRALVGKKDLEGAKAQLQSCELARIAIVAAMNQRTDGLNRKVVDRKFISGRRFPFGGFGRGF